MIGAQESIGVDEVEADTELSRHLLQQIDTPLREFLKAKTTDEAKETLEKADIECIPVLTLDRVMEDPQFKAREMLVEVEHPRIGKLRIPGVVSKFSKTPGSVETPGPLLGQHNEEVYCGLLGYTKDALDRLQEDKIM
jgi:CoA:oxalate CoA-transferase